MNITQKQKREITKGAVIGGVLGAFIGLPVIGAVTGGYLNYEENKTKRGKRK